MKSVVLHSLLICLTAGVALAQSAGPQPQSPTNWFVGGNMPGPTPADAESVKIDEHPNAQLPLDLSFVDEAGKTVQLKQYFSSGKPVVLQFGYFGCPMLCSLVSQALVDSLKDVKLNAGSD